jgi:hypothetical protein
MSLELLQELSPEYTQYLVEGMHKLMSAAAEQRRYDDVSILSSVLSSLKAHENVTEVGYRNGEAKAEEPPAGLEDFILINLVKFFETLEEDEEVTSYKLLEYVESVLQEQSPSALAYRGSYARDFWKVCTERSLEKLLADCIILKKSRYKYSKGTMPCWNQSSSK